MTIAIIPARGGSKRIPGKNARPFLGTPIIQRVIATALETGIFNHIMVSTDDRHIADLARKAGAKVPFLRRPHLADDFTTTLAVIADAIAELDQQKICADHYCCLYPTAVMTTADLIKSCYDLFVGSGADYAFPIVAYNHPISRALENVEGRLYMIAQENKSQRTQDMATPFHDTGQFYWGKRQCFLAQTSVFEGGAVGYQIDRHSVVDIDTEEDWQHAEMLFQYRTRDSKIACE